MAKRPTTKKAKKTTKVTRTTGVSNNWIIQADAFLEKYRRMVMVSLVGLSLLLSAIYYFQAKDSAIMTVYKWVNSDMNFFDVWAKDIVAGDWLGRDALHPYHNWHDDLAREYFQQFPDVAAQYGYSATDSLSAENAKHALINDIYKDKTYHQEPLYPYLLAITYSIFGTDHQWVYFWQFILAALTSVFVFLIGRHFFGSLAGLLAALFVTLCGSIMVFEMVLLRTTMTNFFTALLLYLFLRVLQKQTWQQHAIFGVASGLALLGQSYMILFIVPAIIWLFWQQRKIRSTVGLNMGACIGSLLLIMSPLFIRNAIVGAPVMASASHGAMAYIPMNVENSAPMESFYVHMPTLARIRHDSEGKMIPAAIESLKTFSSFKSFWDIYNQKIGGLFMWYEIANNMNYYLYREIAPVLKMLPVHYFFIAPLGLAGLILGIWGQRRNILPLLLMTVVCIVPLMIAGNLARYRTPFVIMMSIFAAYFLVQVITFFFQNQLKHALISIGIAIIAFAYTTTREDPFQFVYHGFDLDAFYRYYYLDKLIEYEETGNYNDYLKLTTHMMEDLPDYYMNVKLEDKIRKGNEAETSRQIANYMESHVNILKYLKRDQEAAFYQDRINILRARIEDFNRRLGAQ